MKVDVENLIELIENAYPPIKHSAYWQDLLKLIPMEPQASRPSGQGMRWRPFKEKPKSEGWKITQNVVDDPRSVSVLFYYMGVWLNGNDDGAENIEVGILPGFRWLDETPTPESQWPTEWPGKEKIGTAYTDFRNSIPKDYSSYGIWKAAIQWLQTSGVREGTREREIMKEFTFWLGQNHLPIVSAMHFEMFLNSKKV